MVTKLRIAALKRDISGWQYLADSFPYEHQKSLRLGILRKVKDLKEELKDLKEQNEK